MIPLICEERKLHRKQKNCYIYKKFSTDDDNEIAFNKNYLKVKIFPVIFHNGSQYDFSKN